MNLRVGPMKTFIRLTIFLIVFLAGAGCSRAIDRAPAPLATEGEEVAQSEGDTMSLNLNALNYTEIPIGKFYVNGTWGGNVRSRIGSGGIGILCCVSLPKKWHPGLNITVEWRDDEMYKNDPNSLASRAVPVEKYEYFSDGFLWVLFFPGGKIKAYASKWMPGFPGFPEGLQAPNVACPGHFTLLNSDPRCPAPDKRIKP
ncbi:DUF3304 domain-containing protein [Burkholderia thailandensis]|uniref:Lipoprotein, putative n=2 Tax=Burkholderia thailandensis TaxID=57975 RepID=Q2SV32_BURTA|nr:DUF3304 domain-containing protein [Burkholderia thailandensis]ABC38815.1 lipoprotein, putative [Burkholderia thailandensis E264]AOJ44971.1 hypothetical protein WJ27_07545 [Burkholderia thailandensis]AOJ51215.1 hypothetical protein AQ475_10585 [Burkholderia thailandensis]AVR10417.1 DUF3304 domain-containing protein [Burkholderia thailandensis]AVR26649.1 DUF3304 domain-containing protein [Burkholderia thailandensis]